MFHDVTRCAYQNTLPYQKSWLLFHHRPLKQKSRLLILCEYKLRVWKSLLLSNTALLLSNEAPSEQSKTNSSCQDHDILRLPRGTPKYWDHTIRCHFPPIILIPSYYHAWGVNIEKKNRIISSPISYEAFFERNHIRRAVRQDSIRSSKSRHVSNI